jgi:hypothetical protein
MLLSCSPVCAEQSQVARNYVMQWMAKRAKPPKRRQTPVWN